MRRMTRAVFVLGSSLVVVAFADVARADACLGLEAVCPLETLDPIGAVDDPVEDAVDDTVDDTVDGAVRTVVDVLDDDGDVTEPVVGPIREVVDDLLGDGGIVEPPDGREASGGPGGGDGERNERAGRPNDDVDRRPVAGTEPRALLREGVRPAATLIGSAASGSRTGGPHGSPGGFEGDVQGALRGLVLVLVLFGLTVGFVLVQARIDRNDPKISAARVRSDVVRFA